MAKLFFRKKDSNEVYEKGIYPVFFDRIEEKTIKEKLCYNVVFELAIDSPKYNNKIISLLIWPDKVPNSNDYCIKEGNKLHKLLIGLLPNGFEEGIDPLSLNSIVDKYNTKFNLAIDKKRSASPNPNFPDSYNIFIDISKIEKQEIKERREPKPEIPKVQELEDDEAPF